MARHLQERLQEQQQRILRGGGVRDRRLLPVPGQQLVQPSRRVVGDAAQHVGEPGLGVDIVELGGGDRKHPAKATG